MQAAARLEVGVVDDDVRARDAAPVVVVVDDGDLVFAEVLAHPRVRQAAQALQIDAVAGVRRDHVMAERDGALALPRPVVAAVAAQRVHLARPTDHVLKRLVQSLVLGLVPGEVEEIAHESAAALLEVSLDARASHVPVDGLEHRHGYRQNLSEPRTSATIALISSTEPSTSSSSSAARESSSLATCGSTVPLFLTNMATVLRARTAWL